MVKEFHRAGYPIAIHASGDAAIDDVLHAFWDAQREVPRRDARHRIEHCQMVRQDQLDTIAELGLSPSFFVGHVYYWGGRHRDIFMGPERAAGISALRSAIDRGIRFTVHDDTPVTPVNPLQLMWASVNRLTKTNHVLGPDERIPPIDALRAVAELRGGDQGVDGAGKVGGSRHPVRQPAHGRAVSHQGHSRARDDRRRAGRVSRRRRVAVVHRRPAILFGDEPPIRHL